MEILPVEVTSRNDLASLRRASKDWRDVTSPILFETLIIEADEGNMDELDSKPYESLEEASFDCLQLVRHFKIHADFHDCLKSRCPHGYFPGGPYPWECDGVEALGIKIFPLFKQLKPSALRSFRWDLGSCMHKDILGYLQREQPDIECILLNTGAPTDSDTYPPLSLMLGSFRLLRNLSWTGVRNASELESLRVFLATNKDILETLELDFIHRDSVNHASLTGLGDEDPGVFTTNILPLSPDAIINSFPALTTLSLSAVCLPVDLDGTVSAFDFGQLCALKVHRCKGTHLLLRAIVKAAQSLKLESLDLVMDDFAAKEDWGGSSLTAFLRSFSGLRHLYLMITPPGVMTTEPYFDSILCHVATMKRLVYHERSLHRPESIHTSKDKNLIFEIPGLGGDSTGAMHRFMQQSNLESLGCCDSLSQLRRSMEPYNSAQSLRFLHVRCSKHGFKPYLRDNVVKWTVDGIVEPVGPDNYSAEAIANFELFDFVRWAFGSRGLPKLRILAFGDFSYDGRHKGKSLLFYRQRIGSPYGFRLASKENVIDLSGIDKPFDFLGACPTDPLYPR
ncbi:MAG: hypothetical protein ASARMPRED_001820 [Alectoria sarmentosa]|nr:MAG: hypothetical protein ASARMPRED_001820 [Alectoria sarmentosa]